MCDDWWQARHYGAFAWRNNPLSNVKGKCLDGGYTVMLAIMKTDFQFLSEQKCPLVAACVICYADRQAAEIESICVIRLMIDSDVP